MAAGPIQPSERLIKEAASRVCYLSLKKAEELLKSDAPFAPEKMSALADLIGSSGSLIAEDEPSEDDDDV